MIEPATGPAPKECLARVATNGTNRATVGVGTNTRHTGRDN